MSAGGCFRKGETPKEKVEESGSSAYVPKEPEKDQQLQYALKLLRGEVTAPPKAAEVAQPAAETVKPGASKTDVKPDAKPEEKKQ